MKAIAYVCDVLLKENTTISRELQKTNIEKYAQLYGVELLEVFEDEVYTEENIIQRPGVQNLLNCQKPYDIILVDRIWSLGRHASKLNSFIKEIEAKGKSLIATTVLWDVASQTIRKRYKMMEKQILRQANIPVVENNADQWKSKASGSKLELNLS